MILFINGDGEIKSYSAGLTEREEEIAVQRGGIRYDGKFSFLDGEYREGYVKKHYYTGGAIETRYEPITETEKSKIDELLEVSKSNNKFLIGIRDFLTGKK